MQYPDDYRAFLKANDWEEFAKSDHETDQRKGLPYPPPEKPYPGDAKLLDLVAPEDIKIGDAPLRLVMAQRRSRRQHTQQPLTLEELSFLLWATQGVREVADTAHGKFTRRTVPSGGSLHSFETYLAVNRVEGIEPGLYRYLPLEHKLLFIRQDEHLQEHIVEACSGQAFAGKAAVVFFWTTIPYRMEWRYSIVAAKIIAQDSGHLCQNLYLASEAIGAGVCAIGAYSQNKADEFLGVDSKDEFVVYVSPVGKVEQQ